MNPKFCSVLVVVCVCLMGAQAQKTAQRWNSAGQRQQAPQSSGNNQQSVYGGYGDQQQQSAFSDLDSQRQQPVSIPTKSRPSQSQQASRPANRPTQPIYQQQQQQDTSYDSSADSSSSSEADAEPAQYGAVSGQPGKDFPAYTRVPKTSFSCDGLPYDYGMYADEETGCQAYHLCYNGRKESFLCGVGTVFNQRILHCDYWYSVDCGKSSQYYSSNAYMGSSQPEPGPAEANASPSVQQQQQQSSYGNQRAPSKTNNNNNNNNRPQQSSASFSRQTQQTQESY